jgi:trimeric autotransporter adhesin
MNPLERTIPLFAVSLVCACFAFSPTSQAVSPTPDGLYPGANVAEGGSGALHSLTNGTNNTAIGSEALFSLTGGTKNTAVGAQALKNSQNGAFNTAVGFQALVRADFNADENTATGYRALFSNVSGGDNTAIGFQALYHNDIGFSNTAVGWLALFGNTSGSDNIALGKFAGWNLTFGSNNIDIGNSGIAGEDSTIRIGNIQSTTYIAGISGANATGGNEVFVTSDGKLGTVNTPSSARFKENIQPMDRASEVILSLKPVTFHYKKELDPKAIPQFGLVAEEVVEVNPDLVKRDRDGNLQTVRYEAVNAMLLNEFLKEHRTVQEQQKEIDAIKAELKEQKALIQKVSDKVELNRPAPQMAVNNQ